MQWILLAVVASSSLLEADASHEKGLPPLDRPGLISLIESKQAGLRRAQAVYRVRHGSVEGSGDASTAPFVPDPLGTEEAAESAFDTSSGVIYLHHERLLKKGGNPLTNEFLYDGKRGWHLGQAFYDPKIWLADVTAGWPREMGRDRGVVLRADEVTYRPIAADSLAAVVRRASEIKISPEVLKGHAAYKVTLFVLTDAIVEYQGKTVKGKTASRHRLWLAPDRNMLPLRVEELPLVLGAQTGTTRPGDAEVKATQFFEPSDFREIAPGVWWPFKVRKCVLPLGVKPMVTELTFDTVALNEKASIPDRLDLPVGTHVTDLVRGLKYVQGPGGEIRRARPRPMLHRESPASLPSGEQE